MRKDETNIDLKYANANWLLGYLHCGQSAGNVSWYTSITIDSRDKVHISYYNRAKVDLKVRDRERSDNTKVQPCC